MNSEQRERMSVGGANLANIVSQQCCAVSVSLQHAGDA